MASIVSGVRSDMYLCSTGINVHAHSRNAAPHACQACHRLQEPKADWSHSHRHKPCCCNTAQHLAQGHALQYMALMKSL